jgi:MATE family multidrug resistance protein
MSVTHWPQAAAGRVQRLLRVPSQPGLPGAAKSESDLRGLIRLALPSMVATAAGTAMSFVDFAFVSCLGSASQAAVGNASVLVWTLFGLGTGIVTAISTFASQALGQGKPREGAAYMWQAVYLSLGFGVLGLALIPLVPWVYGALGHPAGVAALEVPFTQIMLLAAFPAIGAAAVSNYFNGIHRPVVTMTSMIVANLFHVVLAYALIFGRFGLPAMGVVGAAWSTVVSLGLRMGWLLLAMSGSDFRREFEPFTYWRYAGGRMWNMLKVGAPVGLQWVADIGTWALFANWLISRFGTADIAATQIVWKLLELSWMPAIGIGIGINAAVGKAIGAGDVELARRRARIGVLLSVGYMGMMGTIFALFRYPLVGLLAADPGVLRLGANLMLLAAAFQIFDAMSISYGSALRGAGDTKWPAIVLATYCYGIVIAGGWALTVARPGLGSYGPWIMCTIYAILLSLTLRYRWARGAWKRINIFAGAAAGDANVADGRLQEDGIDAQDGLFHEGRPRPARARVAEALE